MNAEFQRIARSDKKAFLSDQFKEIEEDIEWERLFKKIIDTKGLFPAKMGTIKDRSGRDLREAEDTKKRWQEYTEELYKKDLHDPDNHTVPQPDILECEVKWGSVTTNKASGGDGIPAVTMSGNLENSAVATELEKVTFHSNPKEKQCQKMFKLPYNCTHFTC